jgi:hypothetical protein
MASQLSHARHVDMASKKIIEMLVVEKLKN